MIEWLRTWANQIIIAIIIAVIFEMIIPNSKNKKYIKMVINLYVLFVLINPIISEFTDIDSLDLSKYDYKKYISQNTIVVSSNKSEEIIKSTFEKSIKEDIQRKLKEQGYKVKSISINIDNSNYEKINWIRLSITNKNNYHNSEQKNVGVAQLDAYSSCNEQSSNKASIQGDPNNVLIQVNTVEEINISTNNDKKNEDLRENEKKKIKKLISKEYEISEEKILIN